MKDFIEVASASNKQNNMDVIYNFLHSIVVLLSYKTAFTFFFSKF